MSYLIKNITLHQMYSDEKAHCLYCQEICLFAGYHYDNLVASSAWNVKSQSYSDEFTFTCEKCDESFKFIEYDGACTSFTFTCKDMMITIYYDTENFSLEKRSGDLKRSINRGWVNGLDNVNFDFSNKDKLYNKIKTYLLMT